MNCRDVMTEAPVTCAPTDPVREAATLMRRHDVGSLPVVHPGADRRLVGIITDRDLALRVVAEGLSSDETPVEAVMTPEVVSCLSTGAYQEALQLMADRQVRRIPVVDGDRRLVGIIAQADVARRVAQANTTGLLVEAISEPAVTASA
jgi:CBS domain-containing protein